MAAAARRALMWRSRLLALGVLVAIWVLCTVTAQPQPLLPFGLLRVGIDPSNPPFAFDSDGAYAGFEVELARELADQLGASVGFVGLGFDGGYDALRVDQVDVLIASLVPDPSQMADVRYSQPYYDSGLVLAAANPGFATSMPAMAGHRLAYAFGSQADAEARRWLRRVGAFSLLPYETPSIALDAARLGAADAALVQMTDARLYLRVHRDWHAMLTPVTHVPLVMAVRGDRERLRAALDDALSALRARGSFDLLLARWL